MKKKKIFATIFVIECLEQSLQKGGKAGCTSEEKEKLLKLNKKLKKVLTFVLMDGNISFVRRT
ncbi:MAG: hypothetical protein SOU09_01605 [Faecalimonas umbilicata]|uniref:hypothetical protein n=1 Tax=Faecalimonas umbilicata TaxID=1912855 RepID=UPI002A7610FE|nr:hypothetical protein [Faecalimonas umbilicata]MDY2760766.1 hypothetical protein [Faecalimonas umbilicata]